MVLVLAGLGSGGFYFWRARAAASADKPKNPTATVERGMIRLSVAATGRTVSNLDVDIKCKASGQVAKLPFDVSDVVKEGELLMELDPIDEQRAVNLAQVAVQSSIAKVTQAKHNLVVAEMTLRSDRLKAEAAVKSAEARAARARIKAQRLKETLDQAFTTQEEYDDAAAAAVEVEADAETSRVHLNEELKTQEAALELRRQDIKLADAEVESDKIALANAQQRLKDTTVKSPITGVVAARNVQIGTIISSGVTNVGGGTTVLTLSDLSRIFILAAVDESDIGKVALKQKVIVTADAFPGTTFKGEVVRIATKGVNVSNVVTFEVKIEVTSENKAKLKPEMTSNLEIVSVQKDEVLLVPSEAVVRKQRQRFATVVRPDGQAEEREVKVGINDGAKVEIASGLAEGDVVEVRKNEGGEKWRNDANSAAPNPARMMGIGGGGG
jgi:RND family efflux transporter MFP subunit